jgi:hypothetical protein
MWAGRNEVGEKNCDFYGRSTFLVIMQLDEWVRREGQGGPELGEKSFQLSSLLIYTITSEDVGIHES